MSARAGLMKYRQRPAGHGPGPTARAGEGLRALAAVRRVAAAVLQAQHFGRAAVELVVAHRDHAQAHQIHGLDGGLVAEQ